MSKKATILPPIFFFDDFEELLDDERRPIPGFAKADCRPFQGDQKLAPIAWKGANVPTREAVRIRFDISSDMLYGHAWVQNS